MEEAHSPERSTSPNKKQKLNNDAPTQSTETSQPNSLLLDKDQNDTINELIGNSRQTDQEPTEETSHDTIEIKVQDKTESTEPETVTALLVEKTDDNAITSEQLLYALTSAPPHATKETEAEKKPMSEPRLSLESKPKTPSKPSLAQNFLSTNMIPSTTLKSVNDSPTHSANTTSLSTALTNLPDISAALRRLSNANMMEQFNTTSLPSQSSSPRLPSMGHHSLSDRKGSVGDVSPSEILGNALAAVAANAARSSSPQTSQPSVVQSNSPHAQATATAIGNLAAITANISNLLHSGGFHRNSFSQEDTQKLAAAVARQAQAQQQQQQKPSLQRRKSSMAAFMDQTPKAKTFATHSTVHKPKLIVKNDQVWKAVEGIEERLLGFELYSPHLLLPNLENCVNGLIEVRVPARFLTFDNVRVKKKSIWGTDIYTDDSDIVAMAIHSGKYQPQFIEPTVEPGDPFALAVAGKQRESIEAAKQLALSGKKYVHRHDHLIPDHDLKVTVKVLPTLRHYASTIRSRIKSREWGRHDGMSLYVSRVEMIKKGDARVKGRRSLKSDMFVHEPYRKQTLGIVKQPKLIIEQKEQEEAASNKPERGRIKKTRRVMRMFQIRANHTN